MGGTPDIVTTVLYYGDVRPSPVYLVKYE